MSGPDSCPRALVRKLQPFPHLSQEADVPQQVGGATEGLRPSKMQGDAGEGRKREERSGFVSQTPDFFCRWTGLESTEPERLSS